MSFGSTFADNVTSQINSALNTVSNTFTQEGAKATSGQQDETSQLIDQLSSLQQNTISTSLFRHIISITNFTEQSNVSDWKNRYPYRLSIREVSTASGNTQYYTKAAFRLLIGPQDITINAPFAIKTTVTSDGILEEHNGIPLRQINLSGTTGTNLARPSNDMSKADTSILGTLFGGTINAANSFVKSLSSARDQLTNAFVSSSGTKVAAKPGFDTRGTGYYQYHMLRIFLETYATLKKSPHGRKYRLAFEMYKDRQAYLVTPNVFQTKKSATSPLEYMYNLSMTAWASIPLGNTQPFTDPSGTAQIKNDIGTTQKLFNAMNNLRTVAQKANNVISNAQADVETNIFGPINNLILLTKDTLGIPLNLADLPNSLQSSFQTTVIANWDALSRTNETLKQRFDAKFQTIINSNSSSNSAQPYLSSNVPGSQNYYVSGVFADIDLTSTIDLNSLGPTDAQQREVTASVQLALQTTSNDMIKLAGKLQQLSDALAPSITSLAATDPTWDVLYATQESIAAIYASIADGSYRVSTYTDNTASTNIGQATTALDFWEQSTAANNIPFNRYTSKFAVPFPFRSSLEELARIYLGDATLWPDIAALNGLQAPYVDEEGFYYSFINNGSLQTFNVATNTNLYVGQVIYISSNAQVSSKRKIMAINEITQTNFQIVVDGAPNLSDYTVSDQAQMKAYLPYTINSLKRIYIPTNATADYDDPETKPISFINEDIDLIKFSKIDWLLDSNYDLAVTSDGFINLAYGTSNLLQAAKLKLITIAGSKLLDPNYGAAVDVGDSMADLDVNQIVSNINSSFASDPRFNAPSSINIDLTPNAMTLNVVVSVKNGGGIMPITIPLTS